MRIGIGIDTGGTYTDAVVFDLDTHEVLASGKARTTKEDLRVCVLAAIDCLPVELARQAETVALSTTLATNACVEGKGARAKLILMGTPERAMRSMNVMERYGINPDDVLCLDTKSSFDGMRIDDPDWPQVLEDNAGWFQGAQALAISEMNALRNGALMERAGVKFLKEQLNVPVIAATDVAHELNMVERGATALLNVRLMPVVEEFLAAVRSALDERGIEGKPMVVRSDGSFMNEAQTRESAVETIVSGPAASVQGCEELTDCADYLVVDMGGTTTDVSLVTASMPLMTRGTRIGVWRTQVAGVFVDTFGLGGDSAVKIAPNGIELTRRRVEPLCVAAARWPQITERLEEILDPTLAHVGREVYEVLYLVRDPHDMSGYSQVEQDLVARLRDEPMIIGLQDFAEIFRLDGTHITERLESEGVIMRAGFTPTDAMHIKGDFSGFDTRASLLAARYLTRAIALYDETPEDVIRLCDDVYDAVGSKLYANLVRVLWQNAQPKNLRDIYPESLDALLKRRWNQIRQGQDDMLALSISTPAKLVGVGAPIGIFLPRVAQALGTDYVIPPHAEVANAIGAITTHVRAQVHIEVRAYYKDASFVGYTVPYEQGSKLIEDLDDALAFAKEVSTRQAKDEAYARGAKGDLTCTFTMQSNISHAFGLAIHFSTDCIATACER